MWAWLELLRLPNLFTVPGDAVAGYVLASGGQLRPPAVLLAGTAGLALYCSGLILNDLRDCAEDSIWRPERPLPSGRISREKAAVVMAILFAVGLLAAAAAGIRPLLVALALAVGVIIYNSGLKSVPGVGALIMGLCRALNVLLGAAAVPYGAGTAPALVGAGILGLYIAVVTQAARAESHPELAQGAAWAVPLVVGVGFVMMLAFVWTSPAAGVVGFLCLWAAAFALSFVPWLLLESRHYVYLPRFFLRALALPHRFPSPPEGVPGPSGFLPTRDAELVARLRRESISLLVSLLLLMQAALVVGRGQTPAAWAAGGVLLAAWGANRLAARWIAGS
ncbi:MAG TPA: hypothetical protein EYP62_07895 [Kiritimatiellae bacterium]|nr:hypothetical protein [Kiritimatiellia bacterium]